MVKKEYRLECAEQYPLYVVQVKKRLWVFSWWEDVTRMMSLYEAEQAYNLLTKTNKNEK